MAGNGIRLHPDSEQMGLNHPLDQVGVVMVPFPCHSHLNQLLHLSHILAASYAIPVHYAGSATYNHQAKLRHYSDPNCTSRKTKLVHFHDFLLPTNNPINKNSSFLELVLPTVLNLRQHVTQLLQELANKYRRIVVIHDCLMSSVVENVKSIPNAEAYTFNPLSAFYVFFDCMESFAGDTKPFQLDNEDDQISRCIPSHEGCFPSDFEDFASRQYRLNSDFESGRLFNTSRVIEGKYIELLEKLISLESLTPCKTKQFFAIGPLNPVDVTAKNIKHAGQSMHKVLEWLNQQDKESVIYVSFGTTTLMSNEQIRELANGLEGSGQKFIWALIAPDIEHGTMEVQLPEGYECGEINNRGIIMREWAPQIEILEHPAIGGFMSHCGWGSCIESISSGVPIAAWPMHSDQPINSILVTQVLRIGVLVRNWSSRAELVTSSMIENAVRRLMSTQEGKEMKKRANKLGSAVRGSLVHSGASRLELDSFVAHITR